MFKKYKVGLSIAAVYIGAVMGAGFATGQELLRYFVRFGGTGLWGLIFCGFIFALVGFKVLYFMHINSLTDYREFLHCILGKKLGIAAEAVSFCFIIALYSSMLAATGALCRQWLGIEGGFGNIIMAIICSLLVAGGIKSLGAINFMLCPLLIGGSTLVGLWLYFGSVQVFAPSLRIDDNILGSAIVYISYNIISSVSLLCAVSKQIHSLKDALIGGGAGGIIVGLIGLALALPLYKYFNIVSNSELPVFSLISCGSENSVLKLGYILLLIAAILTTATGNCYSAVECLCPKTKKERIFWVMLVSSAALLLSYMGFENIVGKLYYVFGCIGIAQLMIIVNLKLKKPIEKA